MRRILFIAVLACCFCVQAPAAEVTVEPTAELHTLIDVATPTEGTGYAWFVMGPRGMERWVATGPNNQSIAFTGPPGKYTVMLVVQLQGGGLDQGFANVQVGKEAPGPDPPPPPPPPIEEELWGYVLVYESEQMTPELASILTDSKDLISSYLEESGLAKEIVEVDSVGPDGKLPEHLKQYVADAKGKVPMLFIMGTEGGEFYKGKVPATPQALVDLVEKYLGESTP